MSSILFRVLAISMVMIFSATSCGPPAGKPRVSKFRFENDNQKKVLPPCEDARAIRLDSGECVQQGDPRQK